MDFKDLLHRQRSNVALLVGNGINRYGTTADGSSWDALLRALAQKLLDPGHTRLPSGISLTEFYDVLELSCALGNGKSGLQAQFCDLLASRRRQPRHIKVIS
ncbi:MAG TPA: hypothetical protein DHV59_08470 [Oxalobacteraceae bacterium]|nr:hypothetical protein [Oxalobacteraceae bacterium]